jgi:hypothetical protein
MIAEIIFDPFNVESCVLQFFKATIIKSRLDIVQNKKSFNMQIVENN